MTSYFSLCFLHLIKSVVILIHNQSFKNNVDVFLLTILHIFWTPSFAPQAPREALAKSVLAEVPAQLVDFFNTMKLIPPNSTNPAPNPSGTNWYHKEETRQTLVSSPADHSFISSHHQTTVIATLSKLDHFYFPSCIPASSLTTTRTTHNTPYISSIHKDPAVVLWVDFSFSYWLLLQLYKRHQT